MTEPKTLLTKKTTYFGHEVIFACDQNCQKAFGMNGRKTTQLSDDEDDFQYLTDAEVGDAPKCAGTWEGGQGKPASINEAPNKWCVRECERSSLIGKDDKSAIDDFSKPVFNFIERAKSELSGNGKISITLVN